MKVDQSHFKLGLSFMGDEAHIVKSLHNIFSCLQAVHCYYMQRARFDDVCFVLII